MRAPLHVLILGAGFAGLETAFQLRHRLGERVRLTLVTDDARFLFRPNTIYVPFGLDPSALEVPLAAPLARRDIALVQGRAWGIDPVARTVELAGGRLLDYDMLVVATGAAARLSEVPGLAEHATSVWTPGGMLGLREHLARAVRRGRDGLRTRLVFLVPPGNQCPGPLYELVQMADVHLRRRDARAHVELAWASPEEHFLPAFGPRVHEVVARALRVRGVEAHRGCVASRVEPGTIHFAHGQRMDFDELVTFPAEVAAVQWTALPRDARGFIQCEGPTRQVVGHPGIYAPGDAGDFPLKQAFLALLQAGAVADDIAAHVEGRPLRTPFDPVTLCIIEQLDGATFTQVPLRAVRTSAGGSRVEVDGARGALYRIGSGRVWQACKKGLGLYTARRYAAGAPFHAGAAWSLVDLGLKVMRGALTA